jgi:hypothetical protein
MKALVEMELVRAIYPDRERDSNRHAKRAADLAAGDDVVIRRGNGRDAKRLKRLAQLDSARVPAGPTLVAELDGMLVAALPLSGGAPLADPFAPTAPLVKLLELRRTQLRPVV